MPVAGLGYPLSGVRIAYTNLAASGTPTATSEASGYPASDAFSWSSHRRWTAASSAQQNLDVDLGSAQSVDCFGLYKHNLGDIAGAVSVKYSTTSAGGAYTSLFDIIPANNATLFRVNSSGVTARWWRFSFSGHNAAPSVGVAFLGAAVLLPPLETGFNVPIGARDSKILNAESEGGEFLGRSVLRQGFKTGFEFSRMDEGWLRSVWEPFLRAAEVAPFFFAWDINRYPSEAYYCFVDKPPKPARSLEAAHHKVVMTFVAK